MRASKRNRKMALARRLGGAAGRDSGGVGSGALLLRGLAAAARGGGGGGNPDDHAQHAACGASFLEAVQRALLIASAAATGSESLTSSSSVAWGSALGRGRTAPPHDDTSAGSWASATSALFEGRQWAWRAACAARAAAGDDLSALAPEQAVLALQVCPFVT